MEITIWNSSLEPAEATELIEAARRVLDAALDPEFRDDRFSASWASSLTEAEVAFAVASENGIPFALLGGMPSEGALQLDALVSAAAANPGQVLGQLFDALATTTANQERLELWAKPTSDVHENLARDLGFEPLRALHQMRCSLPVSFDAIPTRPFVLGQDENALLRVNNRAFANHPDQGNMTLEDLAHAATEPWFDPDGIRLYEEDGDLAGFCWTKIHHDPSLGEIYAIGIDPDHHGKGLGVPMTAAGLEWLAAQGLATGMLYVEADNEPALRTYDRLGFNVVRTDRAWLRT